jgi:hypothetical protein
MQNLLKSERCLIINQIQPVQLNCAAECWRLACQCDDVDLQLLRAGQYKCELIIT